MARLHSVRKNTGKGTFVSGTVSQLAEKLGSFAVLKGHDFSRADKANKIYGALAPEGPIFNCRVNLFQQAIEIEPDLKRFRLEPEIRQHTNPHSAPAGG